MSEIRIIIDFDNGNINKVTDESEKKFKKSGNKAGKNFSDAFSFSVGGTLKTLRNIGAVAAGIGGLSLVKSVKDAASLEVINTQFEVMLKSASAAKKQVADLQNFAASTPFQLPGLAEAAKQLLSFGITQQEIIPTLKTLGDIAAGVGADITDLTIPFGRLVSTQKLTLQELDKFADRGVNVYASLAKQTGISIKSIRDEISKGKVPFEEFTKTLTNLTGEQGLFFKGMEKQSKTLTGVISTLGDNLFNLSANIGKAFSPFIVAVLNDIIVKVQQFSAAVVKNFDAFEDIIEPILNFNSAFISYVIAPLELLKNIGDIVFRGLVANINFNIARLGALGGAIASVLEGVGLGNSLTQGLKDFADSTEIVAAESGQKAKAALENAFNFSAADSLAQKNEELRTYFQNQREIAVTEGAITQGALKANQDLAVESTQTYASLLIDTFGAVSFAANQTKKQMEIVAEQTANIVKGGLVKSISGGIQTVIGALAKGENAFQALGNFLLSTFGDLAIQLGQFFIAQGIAVTALKSVSGSGAIAAGIGLVALGSLLKSFGGGGGAASVASTNTGTNDNVASGPNGLPLDTNQVEEQKPQTLISVVVEGNVQDKAGYIRDLVQDFSDEGGKQGLKFDNIGVA